MGDKLRQSGTEVGALTAPHEDADQGWLARNIKSLSMGLPHRLLLCFLRATLTM